MFLIPAGGSRVKIYTYFHEQQAQVMEFDAESLKSAGPLLGSLRASIATIDPRDRRVIVVFDGKLLPDGIAHGAKELGSTYTSPVETHVDKVKPARLSNNNEVHIDGNTARVEIRRIGILLPHGRHCVKRFDNTSLRTIYTMINVERSKPSKAGKEPQTFVTYLNSSW